MIPLLVNLLFNTGQCISILFFVYLIITYLFLFHKYLDISSVVERLLFGEKWILNYKKKYHTAIFEWMIWQTRASLLISCCDIALFDRHY